MVDAVEHTLTHYYQPTNHSCGQTATAMLLSFLGRRDTPEDVMESVPVLSVGDVAEWGTLSQTLATWLLREGFHVEMHTADFQLIDLAWAGLETQSLIERMRAAIETRNVLSIGPELSKVALQEYITFIESGGRFHIHPHMSTQLLDRLLTAAPVLVTVSPNVLGYYGRTRNVGLRQSAPDDLHGDLDTHSVVVYGTDGHQAYQIADPWPQKQRAGLYTVDGERLMCAMTASQIQCENSAFQVTSPAG